MTYVLGIDVGTTFTAAALWREGRAETAPLGDRANAVPSVLFLRDDGGWLVGDAAERRATAEPARVAREFKRRTGDPVPVLLGGTSVTPQALMAEMIGWVVRRITEREGEAPARVALTCPATWGSYRQELMTGAAAAAGLLGVGLVTEPAAAAIYYASRERLPAGALVGVYDLGGGTFDATVLRKTSEGFELVGQPTGDDGIGGVDFDQIVLDYVADALGPRWTGLDLGNPAVLSAIAQVRANAVAAKEALSTDLEVGISVILPGVTRQVRLTRAEFGERVRPSLESTIETFYRAIASAQVTPAELHSVLLVGGSSRIPLVSELIATSIGAPVALDAHPKFAVCLGAAIDAARGIEHAPTRGPSRPHPIRPDRQSRKSRRAPQAPPDTATVGGRTSAPPDPAAAAGDTLAAPDAITISSQAPAPLAAASTETLAPPEPAAADGETSAPAAAVAAGDTLAAPDAITISSQAPAPLAAASTETLAPPEPAAADGEAPAPVDASSDPSILLAPQPAAERVPEQAPQDGRERQATVVVLPSPEPAPPAPPTVPDASPEPATRPVALRPEPVRTTEDREQATRRPWLLPVVAGVAAIALIGTVLLAASPWEQPARAKDDTSQTTTPPETSTDSPTSTGGSATSTAPPPRGTRAVLLRDDFSDLSNDWQHGEGPAGWVRYTDGAYQFHAAETKQVMRGEPRGFTATEPSVRLDVSARRLRGPVDAGYGLFCRKSGNGGRFYRLEVQDDGVFYIYKWKDAKWTVLTSGSKPTAIKPGQVNRLQAVCAGGDGEPVTLSLSVNDRLLSEVVDRREPLPPDGAVGVLVFTFLKAPLDVVFDDFAAYAL